MKGLLRRFVETIYGVDGEHATPYMTRICLGRLRLHIFHRGDADPDAHDHPWSFWTFPLTSYVESVFDPVWGTETVRKVGAFRLHHRPADFAHRVIGRAARPTLSIMRSPVDGSLTIHPGSDHQIRRRGKIVTIVWSGREGREWGFWRLADRCWVPWKRYVYGGGKHAPCQPIE